MTVIQGTDSPCPPSSSNLSLARRLVKQVARNEVTVAIAMAVATLVAAYISWQTQLDRHQISTKGLTYNWFGAGGAFAIVKGILYIFALRAAWRLVTTDRWPKVGMSLAALSTCFMLTFTNGSLIHSAWRHSTSIKHWSSVMLFIVVSATVAVVLVLWIWRRASKETLLMVFGVGVNIIPTCIQGLVFGAIGSGSMPAMAIGICLFMVSCMWLLAWVRAQDEGLTGAGYAYRLATLDLIAQMFFLGGGWVIGQKYAGGVWDPYLALHWHTFTDWVAAIL